MQPHEHESRMIMVVMKNRWLRVSRGVLLSLLLLTGAACSGPEAADPVSAAESLVDAPVAQPVATPESNSPGSQESSDFSVFPAFMPSVTFSGDTEECRLSSDPYSTCI